MQSGLNPGKNTELVHTQDCGQVSINISKPGITKGQHWHNSKWELFYCCGRAWFDLGTEY